MDLLAIQGTLKNFLQHHSSKASVRFSRSVVSDSLQPHGLQHIRLPCPTPTPGACSNSCPLSQWCMLINETHKTTRTLKCYLPGLPWWLSSKESACKAGDTGGMNSIPGSGSNSLQYSCLENSMDRGDWWASVHGVTKSRIQLQH